MNMLQSLQKIDVTTLQLIHEYSQNHVFDNIMPLITYLGNGGLVWIVLSIILILNKKYRTIGFMCISAIVLNAIIGEGILKHLVQRPRPFVNMPTIQLLISKPTSFSFPSGHTSTAFAAAGIICSQLGRYKVQVISFACLLAFSRLYLFVHYPSDVLVGIIQGLVCAKIVLNVYPLFIKANKVTFTDVN